MNTRPQPASAPTRLTETFDALDQRRMLVYLVAVLVCLAAAAVAILAPSLLSATPVTGVVVAVAGLVVGTVVGLALDAGDSTVRGPRHVRAVGGELLATLPPRPDPAAADALAARLLERPDDDKLVVGLAAASNHGDVAGWADALGVAMARNGPSVLVADLASGSTVDDGLLEVVRDGVPLGRAVSFERDVKLARVGAGRDARAALELTSSFVSRLPRDLEVLLVALPPLTAREVVAAAEAIDTVVVAAVAQVTARVRLQAAIAAVEGTGATAGVVLLGGRSTGPVAGAGDATGSPQPAASSRSDAPDASDAPDEAATGRADEDSDPAPPDPAPPVDPDPLRPAPIDPGHRRPVEPDSSHELLRKVDLGRRPSSTVRVVHDLPLGAGRPADAGSTDDEPVDGEPADDEGPIVTEGAVAGVDEDRAGQGKEVSTDELPAAAAARAVTDPEEDPLRTTAQLAVLMDELRDRDDDGADEDDGAAATDQDEGPTSG